MHHKFLIVISFLLLCATISSCVPSVSSSVSVNSWVKMEVLSFDGEDIFFNMQIFTVGKHDDKKIWITSEFPSSTGSVYVEVGRGICDVIFHEGMNVTVFSYSYSVNHTYYAAEPKLLGFLLFPWDEHKLVLFIDPSYNFTIDAHEWNCELPSQNYEGKFQVTYAPASNEPLRHRLVLEIKHSASFVNAMSWTLYAIVGTTYALSILLTVIVLLIALGRKSHELSQNLIRVSTAMMFFVPAFEIAFYNIKSPLPLVFSDILMILVIPWNMIILFAVLSFTLRKGNSH